MGFDSKAQSLTGPQSNYFTVSQGVCEEMNKTLYVGNLPFDVTEQQLQELFEQHGEVLAVRMINDRETGRYRGFSFVEMEASGADAAMSALNGAQFGGRTLRVNEAQQREHVGRDEGRRPQRYSDR